MSELKNKKAKGLLLILKFIQQSKDPLSLQTIIQLLHKNDFYVNKRTVERYIKELRESFFISYDFSKKGYALNGLIDEQELTLFVSILQVSVTNEMILNSVKNLKGKKSFILTSNKRSFKGSEHLKRMIEAIEKSKQLKFTYHKQFTNKSNRTVFPRFLKEYENRWYLIAEDKDKNNATRIFGLDRIESPSIYKKQKYVGANDYDLIFEDMIGIDTRSIIEGKSKPIPIIFKAVKPQIQYFKSLPFHKSQEIIEENNDEAIFKIRVYPNYELKQHFFHYTPFVEVLKPDWLRQEIKNDLFHTLKKYE